MRSSFLGMKVGEGRVSGYIQKHTLPMHGFAFAKKILHYLFLGKEKLVKILERDVKQYGC